MNRELVSEARDLNPILGHDQVVGSTVLFYTAVSIISVKKGICWGKEILLGLPLSCRLGTGWFLVRKRLTLPLASPKAREVIG